MSSSHPFISNLLSIDIRAFVVEVYFNDSENDGISVGSGTLIYFTETLSMKDCEKNLNYQIFLSFHF